MAKKFNVTGTCIPEKHFMVNIDNKLNNIMKLIKEEEYFVINRPRQYGKTTTLFLLNRYLKSDKKYLPIKISFEGIGDTIFEKEEAFSQILLELISKSLRLENEDLANFIYEGKFKVINLNELSKMLTNFINKADRRVVLMIDEVDKSVNNQLFLSFLGMLRSKYLLRNEGEDSTFHSVILSGVHDVKSLKLKLRPETLHKYNSPWNIAADFNVDMSFSESEIMTMLDDYCNSLKIKMERGYFAKRLYYYTSGYPFLVSKLCKIIDGEIMQGTEWKNEYMDAAVKKIVNNDNTNFDSLIKNIENNLELYNFLKRIVLDGENITYVKTDEIINLATIYGILKEENGNCKINNRIYEQLIYDHMMMRVIRKNTYTSMSHYNYKDNFIKEDGNLDVRKILIKFQEFMKHEYAQKREAFLEEDGRLVFLAFISPIINGTGFAFKEVTGGEEKRFDIVITYAKKMYILELKIWYGEEYHKRGIIQLGEYLQQYGLDEGYLLIFDFRKIKSLSGSVEEVTVNIGQSDKKLLEVYC